jgi:hypothetical protein
MRVLCKFWLKDGGKDETEIYYGSDVYAFKADYKYATSAGTGYDCVAYFSQVDDLPIFCTAKPIYKPVKIQEDKCECGHDKVPRSGKHSTWCKLYKD